jgi:hypothetical protein
LFGPIRYTSSVLLFESQSGGSALTQRNTGISSPELKPSTLRIVFAFLTAWFAIFGTIIIARSIHWPLVHDSPILLYMVFLSEHGMRLYRDIVEVQFPGSLLLYSFERHVFGTSDLAFRLFDLCGLGVALASMFVIARRRGYWFAAVFGFSFFLLAHTSSFTSITDLGQRDFFIASLLGVAAACLLESFRRQLPLMASGFGFCIALASSIKPTSVIFFLILIPILFHLRKQKISIRSYSGYILAGAALACGIVVSYLLYKQALGAFFHLELKLVPLYSAMAGMSFTGMLRILNAPGHLLLALAIGSLLLVALQRRLLYDVVQQVLLVSTLLGAVSFFLQHKGFIYHRLPFEFFFFLWVGWVLTATAKERPLLMSLGAISLMALSAIYYPHLMASQRYDTRDLTQMQQDLTNLRAADKPGDLQCLDVIGGCITSALRMHIVMSTGYVNDFVFFLDSQDPRVNELREDFLTKLKHRNPRILLLTNEQWPVSEAHGYEKLKNWPQFVDFLQQNYDLSTERVGGPAEHGRGYRIYTRRNNP